MTMLLVAVLAGPPTYQRDPVDDIIRKLDDVSRKTDRMDNKMDAIQSDVTALKVSAARNEERLTNATEQIKEVGAASNSIVARVTSLETWRTDILGKVSGIVLAVSFLGAVFNRLWAKFDKKRGKA